MLEGYATREESQKLGMINWSDGPVAGASASQLEGRGFKSQLSRTTDFKNGAHCLLPWHPIYENGMGKLNTRSYQ